MDGPPSDRGEAEQSKTFEHLVSKVLKDMSGLECRLVQRIKTMETTILSNLASSNPSIADPRQSGEAEYLSAKELEDSYKVLESLVREALAQAKVQPQEAEEAQQVAFQVQERMATVAAKLEQVFGLVRVLNSEDPGCPLYGDSRSSGKISTPPGGCGDIFGQTPLALAVPGISRSTLSLLEMSFGFGRSGRLSQAEPGIERRDSGLAREIREELGKFVRFVNGSANMVDPKRYILSGGGTSRSEGSEFETWTGTDAPTEEEITLDTLVPCPQTAEEEDLYCKPSPASGYYGNEEQPQLQQQQQPQQEPQQQRQMQQYQSTPLETTFPLQPPSRVESYSAQSRDQLRLDPAAYRINGAVASCVDVNSASSAGDDNYHHHHDNNHNHDRGQNRHHHRHRQNHCLQNATQHKRTRSFNISNYVYTPSKQTKLNHYHHHHSHQQPQQQQRQHHRHRLPHMPAMADRPISTAFDLNFDLTFPFSTEIVAGDFPPEVGRAETTAATSTTYTTNADEHAHLGLSIGEGAQAECSPEEHPTRNAFRSNAFSAPTTTAAAELLTSNFRRAKSEVTVKTLQESFKRKDRFVSRKARSRAELADSGEGGGGKGVVVETTDPGLTSGKAWKRGSKLVTTGGVVTERAGLEGSSFYCSPDLPFIDQTPSASMAAEEEEEEGEEEEKEEKVKGHPYLVTETTFAESIPCDDPDCSSSSSSGRGVARESRGAPEAGVVPDIDWPSTSQVTYRKNAARLRSRWDGFRRAFSMVFEKGSSSSSSGNNNNNSNNNNNNNNCNISNNNNNNKHIHCVVRKASSTNFLDGCPSSLLEERKATRSNWEVWKRQSRANLTESFRRKCSWLRMTFGRKKRRRGEGQADPTESPRPLDDVATDSARATVDRSGEPNSEGTQIVIKSTLTSVTDELLKTESDYVSAMRYVIDNYLPLLNHAESAPASAASSSSSSSSSSSANSSYATSGQDGLPALPEALRGKKYVIFGNLEKLLDFHDRRFQESLRMCRGHPYALGAAFLSHEAEFGLYSLYSKNKPKSDALMNDYGRKFFQLKQAELADPMDLESYLLKPIQRLSKYALMLKKILHTCPMDRVEYAELEAALEMIRFQLRHGEDLLAADCITGCDVNLQDQGMLIRREDLVVTKGLRRSLRHVFLFEELVLFSKTKRKPGAQDVYAYKNSIKTTDLGLTESVGDDGRQFEIWFRKRTPENSYRLQAVSRESKDKWTSDIASILWGQTRKCRQRADVNIVMATGLGASAVVPSLYDSSRPVSYASSSSSSSSSNNSMDQRSSSYARHASTTSTTASSLTAASSLAHRAPLEPTGQSSTRARPLTFHPNAPTGQGEATSSVARPLTFAFRTGTKSCLAPPFANSPTQLGFQKLSPVKEQTT